MVEVLIIAAAALAAYAGLSAARRAALRRSRARAEAMLDELAGAVCSALAQGRERTGARALARYERAREGVAAATTRRELELLVARHRLREGALRLAARGLERARDLVAEAVPARR